MFGLQFSFSEKLKRSLKGGSWWNESSWGKWLSLRKQTNAGNSTHSNTERSLCCIQCWDCTRIQTSPKNMTAWRDQEGSFDKSCRALYFTSSYTGLAVTLENDTRHHSDLFPSVVLFPPTWKNQTMGLWISRWRRREGILPNFYLNTATVEIEYKRYTLSCSWPVVLILPRRRKYGWEITWN